MLGLGWLTLKQAHEALRAGRLDEAQTLLVQPQIQGHRRCLELLQQLMRAFVERGEKHLRSDETAKAWMDLLKAEQIGITDNAPIRLRQALTRIGMAEVRALLDAGQPKRTLECLHQLRDRAVSQPEMDGLEQGAKEWIAANEYAEKGEFARALQTLERGGRLLPQHAAALAQVNRTAEQKQQEFGPLVGQLHEAAQVERWPEVLHLSEKLLALAPQHAEVRRLRGRAWKALEPATVLMNRQPAEPPALNGTTAPKKRLILWIDGVGGYLLLLENELTIGQAGPESQADITLLADVSRLHARLKRDSEGYIVEALRPILVNNQTVEKKLLQNGDRLTLGTSCQLLFRQEVPISATARLDPGSGHRFGRGVDGVVLMAETLILGSAEQSHIHLPDLHQPVVLYRNREEIGLRVTEEVSINGHSVKGRGVLEPGCTVTGPAFSMTLELVDGTKSTSSRHSR